MIRTHLRLYNCHPFPFAQLPQYFPYLSALFSKKYFADISAQTQCGICNSTSYALNCLCHSFLNDLPLFCSLQLPDRIPTITEGVLFFLIGISFFEPLAQRVVFIIQKSSRLRGCFKFILFSGRRSPPLLSTATAPGAACPAPDSAPAPAEAAGPPARTGRTSAGSGGCGPRG